MSSGDDPDNIDSGDDESNDSNSDSSKSDSRNVKKKKPLHWSVRMAKDNHLLLSGFFFFLMGSLASYNATAMPDGLRDFLTNYQIGRVFLTVIFLYFASSFVNDQAYELAWTKTVWARFAITGILCLLYFIVTSLNTIGYFVTLILLLTIYTLNDIARNATSISDERKEDLRYAASILTFMTGAWVLCALITNIVWLKKDFRHAIIHPKRPWVPTRKVFKQEEKQSGPI